MNLFFLKLERQDIDQFININKTSWINCFPLYSFFKKNLVALIVC